MTDELWHIYRRFPGCFTGWESLGFEITEDDARRAVAKDRAAVMETLERRARPQRVVKVIKL